MQKHYYVKASLARKARQACRLMFSALRVITLPENDMFEAKVSHYLRLTRMSGQSLSLL